MENSPYNAQGNGVANDTATIQNAINACPNNETVYIPSGTYRISNLSISHPMVLEGAGYGNTVLFITGSGIHVGYNVNIDGPAGAYPTDGYVVRNWTANYTKGANTLTLNSTANIGVGQVIIIDELNDPTFVTIHGNEGYQNCGRNGSINTWSGQNRCLSQIVTVKAINGNNLVVSPSLDLTFNSALNLEAWFWPTNWYPMTSNEPGVLHPMLG